MMDLDQRAERPPSSYGSMKSDVESVIEFTENEELALPAITSQAITGVKLNCVDYPETIFTQTTQQTKPPGADVFDTRCFDELEELEELDEPEEMEDYPVADSPEPPPPVEPDGPQVEEEESSQPGRLHPEQCMPYIFKTMMTVLSELSFQQLMTFVDHAVSESREVSDVLDVVDAMIESRGHEEALVKACQTLETMKLTRQHKDLLRKCIRTRTRTKLKGDIQRMFKVIREGVPQAGKQEFLREIYVEGQLSTQGHGGIDPWHEYRAYPGGHPPLPLPLPYTFITVDNLFRMKNKAGQLVRVATTTGLPGVGKTVLTRKFMLDWADDKANRDFQFVIPLSFRMLKRLRDAEEMSFMIALSYKLRVAKIPLDVLMEADCKFLIIMDGFDEWLQPIDWNDKRQVTHVSQEAHIDAIVVNLLRGTLLPHARLWILGRRAALGQLPPNLVELETELQGFTTENTEQFLRQKFRRNLEVRDQVLPHYRRCPSLVKFCRLPINSWVVYTLMDSRFQYLHYGKFAPKFSEYVCDYMVFELNNYLTSHLRMQSNQIKWREEDHTFLKKMGKFALKLQEKNAWLFSEEEIKEAGLDVKMVTTWCGLCTEVGKEQRQGRKKYCFVHLVLQEYMAALWIYLTFWLDGKNLLAHRALSLWPRPQPPKMFVTKNKHGEEEKSILPLIESAVAKFLGSPPGRYDMMLRHFCSISHAKHVSMLTGRFIPGREPVLVGQEEAAKLLEQKILSHPDRAAVLRVCISEMTEKEY